VVSFFETQCRPIGGVTFHFLSSTLPTPIWERPLQCSALCRIAVMYDRLPGTFKAVGELFTVSCCAN